MLERIAHQLPPEIAHGLTVGALALGLGPVAKDHEGPPVALFGRSLPNRIGLSGGADKNASALDGWRRVGFGFVEAGTVTVNPRQGQPKPRVWRIRDNAMVNAMGLPNRGIEAFRANLVRYRATSAGGTACVGASVATPDGNSVQMRRLGSDLRGLVDFVTLNASCPNTEHEALDLTAILAQIAELREGIGQTPILVKLGPTMVTDALDAMVDAFLEAGVQGFVACNTATEGARRLLGSEAPEFWPRRGDAAVGGYSGPGLAGISLWMVDRIRRRCGAGSTVIGVGGIQTPADLSAMISAGADAVEVYTAVARGGLRALDALRKADADLRLPVHRAGGAG